MESNRIFAMPFSVRHPALDHAAGLVADAVQGHFRNQQRIARGRERSSCRPLTLQAAKLVNKHQARGRHRRRTPVADQGRFFAILLFLKRENPDDRNALFKAIYIANSLGYREFSTAVGWMKPAERLMLMCFKALAPLVGWDRSMRGYAAAQLTTPDVGPLTGTS